MFIETYKFLMSALFPIINATYIKKRKKNGKEHLGRFNERLGIYKVERPDGKLFWFHGASVGESISMLPLIDKLLKEDSELSILVTTGTLTSAEIMAKRLPKRAFHQFVPFDVPKFAKRLLEHFKPDAVLWFESELWPSMLSEVKNSNIPLILVNGRISDKSFANWKKANFVVKEIFDCFNLCLGQSEQDAKRLKFLGAKKVECFGNLKFAGQPLPVDENKLNELKQKIGNRPVFLISSTHSNEEEQFSTHLRWLKQVVSDVLVIVVPRHPNRGVEVAEMYKNKGFNVSLRSKGDDLTETTDIYVADTIGEMGLWYKIAPITFIGGSLVNHGGQNFMEPEREKSATIVGPYMHNFVEMMDRARFNRAIVQVQSAEEVIHQVVDWLKNEDELKESQEAGYNWTVKEAEVLDGIYRSVYKELR